MKRVLVDGRVFSTSAFDRGMGRYVVHLLDVLAEGGHEVTVLLFRNCHLQPDDRTLARFATRFADADAEEYIGESGRRARALHTFTAYLSGLIESEAYDAYVDATPFLGPARLDLFGCAVLAVCYDFIPLKHPDFYLGAEAGRRVYYNGLARLVKADQVVCISETTRDEASRYLAIPASKLTVITPTLEARYLAPPPAHAADDPESDYLFSILGHHKSKNPAGSLAVYRRLLAMTRLQIRVNSPKRDQMEFLHAHLEIPKAIEVTASITDEEKFALQSNARLIAHLSLEEGFGIPLLEGLFLGRKILALDTAINREFFDKAPTGLDRAVFRLSPLSPEFDGSAFVRFLDLPVDPAFFAAIRNWYIGHWRESPSIMTRALNDACAHATVWADALQAKIFSSIPGKACGVADYSVAYARSAAGSVMFFFSEGEQENISHVPNVRAGTHLDFERFSRSRHARVPGLFNFAYSPALNTGIELMRTASKPGDVVLIHERRYFDGLRGMHAAGGSIDELLLSYGGAESPDARTALARTLAFHPEFNSRNTLPPGPVPIDSQWLRALPVRAVSHLSPAVLVQMQAQADREPGSVVNDLASMEGDFDFVPLGIDDRRHPSVARAAQRLRTLRRVQADDIVVGHCGLILNDLKRLWDVVNGFVAYAVRRQHEKRDQRRLFFFLVGKVVDRDFFARIVTVFDEAGLSGRLVHSNPAEEAEFDAEIAACDAIVCFRVQTRGQLSHVFVRSLALGTPVLVNGRSGYAYDQRTTIDDDDVPDGLASAIERLFDADQLADMRVSARRLYQSTHRGDDSLRRILHSGTP